MTSHIIRFPVRHISKYEQIRKDILRVMDIIMDAKFPITDDEEIEIISIILAKFDYALEDMLYVIDDIYLNEYYEK